MSASKVSIVTLNGVIYHGQRLDSRQYGLIFDETRIDEQKDNLEKAVKNKRGNLLYIIGGTKFSHANVEIISERTIAGVKTVVIEVS